MEYPEIEPYEQGMLDVGDGQRVCWGAYGNPEGKPAVALHGGPGSGSGPLYARLFDPSAYRIVVFDQRGTGRSTPNAGDHETGLGTNTTWHLVADIERLRASLGIDRWLVLGLSWGATLALAYAEAHPERVTEIVLGAVTTTQREEIDWMYHVGPPRFFPEAWERFRSTVAPRKRDGDLVEAYAELLNDADEAVRQAAADAWCTWELTYIDLDPNPALTGRFADPRYRRTFARLVTHYFRHGAWLEDGQLLRSAGRLAGIAGTLVHSRMDLGGPPKIAWELHRAWPDAELVIVDEPGHVPNQMNAELVRATNRYAARR